MPIPQLEPKRHASHEDARDASSIRKKRAAERTGGEFSNESGFQSRPLTTKSTGDAGSAAAGKPKQAKKPKKAHRLRRKILKVLLILAVIGLFLGLAGAAGAYFWVSKDLADLTDIEKRAISQATKIYARDGSTLLYEVGDNKRQDVALDQISDQLEWATLALEDKHFYEHRGVSPVSIARAVFANVVKGETTQGASTLTQQFIKNAILTPEQTYTRKAKEAILAIRLEQKYSKDEILNFYLNEVYYGANYQGVEASSQGFFGKSANDVSLAEAATLAALAQNPVVLANDPERLKARRDYALDQMVEQGYVEQAAADEAKLTELTIREEVTSIQAPHFVFYVRSYLEEKYGQNTVRKGGLKVTTTLDWDKQQKGEQAVSDGIPKVEQYGGSNAALVSLDTHTGQVLAMVGSRDFFDESHDGQVNVVTSLRQPGSSFKPIVYLAAFEKGYTPDTRVFDLETDFPTETGNYHPRNYNLGTRGAVTLRSALGQSLNIPAVKLLYLVGVDQALNTAERLGYTSFGDRSRFGLALVLGGGEVTLLEHAAAYGAFSREGYYHAPATILKIEDRDGNVLEEWEDKGQQVVDQNAARTLNSVLSDSNARAGFNWLNLSDRPTAAKTGTTSDFRDAWTVGYTPSVVTGVWTGNNDNSEMGNGADGSIIAAPIWNAYMSAVLAGTPVESFNAASYTSANSALGGALEKTVTKSVDSITGEVIPDECLNSYPAEYVAQKDFKEAHTILYYIDKANPTGPPPSNPAADPMFNSWEGAVQGWMRSPDRANEYFSEATPRAACDLRSPGQQPEVVFRNPDAGVTYTKDDFSMSAHITPGNGRIVTRVEFYIDVVLVEAQNVNIPTEGNAYATYSAATLTAGRHDATVRVTDDKGNVAEDTTTFTFEVAPKKD